MWKCSEKGNNNNYSESLLLKELKGTVYVDTLTQDGIYLLMLLLGFVCMYTAVGRSGSGTSQSANDSCVIMPQKQLELGKCQATDTPHTHTYKHVEYVATTHKYT